MWQIGVILFAVIDASWKLVGHLSERRGLLMSLLQPRLLRSPGTPATLPRSVLVESGVVILRSCEVRPPAEISVDSALGTLVLGLLSSHAFGALSRAFDSVAILAWWVHSLHDYEVRRFSRCLLWMLSRCVGSIVACTSTGRIVTAGVAATFTAIAAWIPSLVPHSIIKQRVFNNGLLLGVQGRVSWSRLIANTLTHAVVVECRLISDGGASTLPASLHVPLRCLRRVYRWNDHQIVWHSPGHWGGRTVFDRRHDVLDPSIYLAHSALRLAQGRESNGRLWRWVRAVDLALHQ